MKNDAIPATKIAAIITDLGGVLIAVNHRSMLAEFARHSSLSAEEIGKSFDPRVLSGHEVELGKGLITPHRFYELVAKQLKLSGLSFEEFKRIYSGLFSRKEDTLAIMRVLCKKYPVAMLSNTNEVHYKRWSKVLGRDMKLFKELVLSFQVGYAKPQPQIYLEAARRLGLEPQQCVYIDDVQEYVDAAEMVGMRGIRFMSARQLKSELEKLGVKA